MSCSSLARGSLDDYVSKANDVIHIKLVSSEDDLKDDSNSFHPEFTHQFFGDSESIFGYRNLRIRLLYSASRLNSFLGVTFSEKINKEKSNGIEADDVLKIIADKLKGRFCYNLDEFNSSLAKEASFKPYGQLVHSFFVDVRPKEGVDAGEGVQKRNYEVYHVDMSQPGFASYHQQMQTFLLWFIDAASYIDPDDDRWDFFLLFEKSPNTTSNGHTAVYRFVGYTSIYRYYAYPMKIRPRIAQCLVLPPFQKQGLGAQMLQTIYDTYSSDNNVLDMTVEDPSENFTRLRDFVDAKNCSKLASFQPNKLKLGWNEEMAKEAQSRLKIIKRQARRVYEILRLRATDLSNPDEYKAYRIDIKQRLNAPYQKELMDYQKLKKCGMITDTELRATILNKDMRIDQLDKMYKELEDEYRHTIERLAEN